MSSPRPWLLFERRGGLAPRDDEALSVAADGTFSARRTIGGPAIGSFSGTVGKRALAGLKTAIDALAVAGDVTIPTPRHGATEVIEAAGRTIRLGSNEVAPKPWRALVNRARRLVQDGVLESPHAAVTLAATASAARLAHAGHAPLAIDVGSLTTSVVHLAEDGTIAGRWSGRLLEQVSNGEELVDQAEWVTAGPGWSMSLPYGQGFVLGAGEWLQVWVGLEIRDDAGPRAGRLYAPVLDG